jgi:small subunit ribosomal protein S7
MPRRGAITRREIDQDPRYKSVLVSKFVNKLMQRGKKSLARRIFYDCCDIVEQRASRSGLEVLEQAVRNASPMVEVKPRRVGGATYQVPVEVPEHRRVSLAIRWILQAARSRPGKTMAEKLANELMDAAKGVGTTIKRRDDTHRMAEANRAFAHYRW